MPSRAPIASATAEDAINDRFQYAAADPYFGRAHVVVVYDDGVQIFYKRRD